MLTQRWQRGMPKTHHLPPQSKYSHIVSYQNDESKDGQPNDGIDDFARADGPVSLMHSPHDCFQSLPRAASPESETKVLSQRCYKIEITLFTGKFELHGYIPYLKRE